MRLLEAAVGVPVADYCLPFRVVNRCCRWSGAVLAAASNERSCQYGEEDEAASHQPGCSLDAASPARSRRQRSPSPTHEQLPSTLPTMSRRRERTRYPLRLGTGAQTGSLSEPALRVSRCGLLPSAFIR